MSVENEIARNDVSKDKTDPTALRSEYLQEAAAPRTVVLTPVTQNGITCQRHDGGTYPENSHYYDCTSLNFTHPYSGYALSQLQSTWGQPGYGTNVENKLASAPVDFYIFDDAIQYANRVGSGLSPQDAYTKYQAEKAVSNGPPFTGGRFTVEWAQDASNPPAYPNEVQAGQSGIKNTTAHEAGHQFDWTVAAGNYPSASAQFATLAAKDKAYMALPASQGGDPNYSTDITQYSYWLQPNSQNEGPYAELFAEEFAIKTADAILVSPPPGVDNVISDYWKCTSFATQHWMTNSSAPVAADFTNDGLSRCN